MALLTVNGQLLNIISENSTKGFYSIFYNKQFIQTLYKES